ncbi:MAG TPA: ribosome-associated translation inhibitor RaiA [Sphingobacteriaceae bacterium]
MKARIQSIRFNADQKLLSFIKKRADKLDQFFDRIISGEIYLRLQNAMDENNKLVEIKISLPGIQLFAKAKCRSFEEAVVLAIESLRRQVNKYKTKLRANLLAHNEPLVEAFA